MCEYKYHKCRVCGDFYDCHYPNWSCSTLNVDETANMCDRCLDAQDEDECWLEDLEDEYFEDEVFEVVDDDDDFIDE